MKAVNHAIQNHYQQPAPQQTPDELQTLAVKMNAVNWAENKIKSSILFLMVPAVYLISQILLGVKFPTIMYYALAAFLGITLFVKTMRDPETAMCVFLVYLPLSKMVPISIAPLVNGTNLLIALLMLALVVQAGREQKPILNSYPLTTLMGFYGVLSSFSAITLIINFGVGAFVDNMLDFKSWLDHFLIFFLFINLIKDTGQARRMIIYLLLSLLVVSLYGVDEMFEKAGRSSIEKSRLVGPQNQSNEFGAYLAHASAPLVGILGMYWSNIRSWAIIPYFVILLKLIIVSYSRGAMLGFGAGAIVAIYSRGLHYLFFAAIAGLIVFYQTPELLPKSVIARFNHTTQDDPGTTQKLDKSANSRLIVWEAAIDMTLDYPVFGAGFKAFSMLKSQYTKEQLKETDTHSMYFFISTQMGIPVLLLFLAILVKMFFLARKVYRYHPSKFARAIGLGGLALITGVVIINIFGTRMLDARTIYPLWVCMAVIIRFYAEMEEYYKETGNKRHLTPIIP